MRILITGTPGTGKTTIRMELEARGYRTYEGNELAAKAKAFVKEEKTEETDIKDLVKIVDEDILADWIEKHIPNGSSEPVFISTHLEGMIDANLFAKAICLTTSLDVLRPRLEERNYAEEKIMDNLTSQAMEEHRIQCEYEFGSPNQGKLLVIDTSENSIDHCVGLILEFVKLS